MNELLQRVAYELDQAERSIGLLLMQMVAGKVDSTDIDEVDEQLRRLSELKAELREVIAEQESS